MIKCICINNKNRPFEIPSKDWVVENDIYKITHIFYHPNQGIQGVSLYEKPLNETHKPYESFMLNRFAILESDLEKFIELMKNCTGLDDVDIESLIEQLELETV